MGGKSVLSLANLELLNSSVQGIPRRERAFPCARSRRRLHIQEYAGHVEKQRVNSKHVIPILRASGVYDAQVACIIYAAAYHGQAGPIVRQGGQRIVQAQQRGRHL